MRPPTLSVVRPALLLTLCWLAACRAPGPATARAPLRHDRCTVLPQHDLHETERPQAAEPSQATMHPKRPEPRAYHGPPPVHAWRRQIIADLLTAGAECAGSDAVVRRSTNPDEVQFRQYPYPAYSRLPPSDPWTFLCQHGGSYGDLFSYVLDFRVSDSDVLVCLREVSAGETAMPVDTPQTRRCQALSDAQRFGSIEIRWGAAPLLSGPMVTPAPPSQAPPSQASQALPSQASPAPAPPPVALAAALPSGLRQRMASYVDCLGSGCDCAHLLAQ